jgi:hypothetical protein
MAYCKVLGILNWINMLMAISLWTAEGEEGICLFLLLK